MLQKCSIFKVMEVFFREPIKYHYLIEISKKSKIAHTSVKKYLEDLKKRGMIKESFEKRGKRRFPLYKANMEDPNFKLYKKLVNLEDLKRSNLIDFLNDNLMPSTIVLFGSYSRGEDVEDSDIDLFLSCKEESLNIKKYEKFLNRKVELHFKENFEDFPKELKNNVINGIVLSGYLEVCK